MDLTKYSSKTNFNYYLSGIMQAAQVPLLKISNILAIPHSHLKNLYIGKSHSTTAEMHKVICYYYFLKLQGELQ